MMRLTTKETNTFEIFTYWILLVLANLSYTLAVHIDCESPPDVLNADANLSLDNNEETISVIYKCREGFMLEGESELFCDLDSDEWHGEPPICRKVEQQNDLSFTSVEQRRRRAKLQSIQEETEINSTFALELDLSCLIGSPVRAPSIDNAHVLKYNRRKKGTHIFLVAFYQCDDDYELDSTEHDRLYCSKQQWIGIQPNCIYLNEDYDGNDDDNEDYNNNENDETYDNEYDRNIDESRNEKNEDDDNNENNEIDARFHQHHETHLFSCNESNGGCDHECEMIDDGSDHRIVNCSCYSGFVLDLEDSRRCYDIDECQNNNGGCEQLCINNPGSYKCSCETGFQIDLSNGKSCIDVNECLLRNGHGPCQDTCINTFGSYRCTCSSLAGTQLADNGHFCVDVGDCAQNNSGCSQRCLSAVGRVFCLCYDGYVLGNDWKTCEDINECENPELFEKCSNGCENTIGSYHCIETSPSTLPPTLIENITATEENPITCPHGFLPNESGNECVCPIGYQLSSNQLTCEDINECDVLADQSPCSHDCVNTIGSFTCMCPVTFHLHDDKQTCTRDYCSDLTNSVLNKKECSHGCFDEIDGFRCTCPNGYKLDNDRKTCIDINECDIENIHCAPGSCVNVPGDFECNCPTGYIAKARRCHDLNECEMNLHNCSHYCQNRDGTYECQCPNGFELAADLRTCADINECSPLSTNYMESICGDTFQCVNLVGSYKCACPDGKILNEYGTGCLTVDLCRINNGGCSHICKSRRDTVICECPQGMELTDDERTCELFNVCEMNNGDCEHICDPVDFTCHCHAGYQLTENQRNCIDVDECQVNNGDCGTKQYCVNTMGSFNCENCEEGFFVQNGTCFDIDECLQDNGGCEHYCINTISSFSCKCRNGFQITDESNKCIDIDECEDDNGKCSHICINLPGTYQCTCPVGQYLVNDEKTCEFVNECEINNGGCSHDCSYETGSIQCFCPDGYQFAENDTIHQQCVDINECDINNGGCSFQCVNHDGYFECSCPQGYTIDKSNHKSCTDTDECLYENGNCSDRCRNTMGSYVCECEQGFELDTDNMTCIDIDECNDNNHGCTHECINNLGSYTCVCPDGFRLRDNSSVCEDIDECANLSSVCKHICVNTVGSYECKCPDGYVLEDNAACADIDECNTGQHHCSQECINTFGSYKCLCQTGYELANDGLTCLDIDECHLSHNGVCSHVCENLKGGFQCRCPAGYLLDADGLTCHDIDECFTNNGNCSDSCVNFPGGYRCDCAEGYRLNEDGLQCDRHDACANNGGCNHICEDRQGIAMCQCYNGFELSSKDNRTCIDIDECQMDHGCQQMCINVIGSHRCKCFDGYRMNERKQCIDIDECQTSTNGGCPDDSKCINLAGSYRCTCPTGFKYVQDKRKCIEIKDYCQPIPPPKNGEVRCSKSRHRTQMFYKTKCTFTCKPGFELSGPATKVCNGSGVWDEGTPICIPILCARLSRPNHGTITPVRCMVGYTFPGERCLLHCEPGFKAIGRKIAVCDYQRNWLPTADLNCVPEYITDAFRPTIKCPQNTTIVLPSNEETVHVKLEQPQTNVNWWKYVDSTPEWGKKLEARLATGVHVISFRARSPSSSLEDICRTYITVQSIHRPEVVYCPQSTDVQLKPNEISHRIYWKEPKFYSDSELNIFRSKIPGDTFSLGNHIIKYVATDINHQSSICEFTIAVKAYRRSDRHYYVDNTSSFQQSSSQSPITTESSILPTSSKSVQLNKQQHYNILPDHESFLMCPGKAAIKIQANFGIQLPRGCFIRNVKLPHIHRRSHSSSILRHYSSWDNPNKPASLLHQYHRSS